VRQAGRGLTARNRTGAGGAAPRVLIGVALIAACTLALQVVLTRVLSAVVYYHFGFLVISLALLGVGAGGLLVYLRPQTFTRDDVEPLLAGWSLALAASLFLVPAVIVRLHFGIATDVTTSFIWTLAVICVLSALPFLAAGIVVALAIKHYVASVGRVYAFDLAGAGIGALGVVPLLGLVDAPLLIVGLGALAAVAAGLFAGRRGGLRPVAAALAIGAALVLLAATISLYHLPPPPGVTTAAPVADRWSPLSRVVGYGPDRTHGPLVTYDRDGAPITPHRRGSPSPDWRTLQLGPQSIGYELTGAGRVLVIGGGGGRDIHNALSSGQREIDVIELNSAIRKVVDDDLAEWSGSPYSLPRVQTTIGDGRSRLGARRARYDQIHIGFTNTLSGNAGSSYALTENNLYTLEAFDEYFDHLAPGGVLNVSRLYRLSGEEALRATVLMLEALRRRGVRAPRRHVVVILGVTYGLFFGTVLARLEPFTEAELATIRRLGRQRGTGVAFAPGGPYQREWRALARAPDAQRFCRSYHVDVCPPTDDRPFFLEATRLSDIRASSAAYIFSPNPFVVLLVALGILLVLAVAAFVLPLALVSVSRRPPWSSLSFFAAIGLGFLIVEIVYIQRFVLFLGFPTYALSVVIFSLLVFTGAGSLLSTRAGDPRRALTLALGLACGLIAVSAYALQPLLRALIDLPFEARIGVAIALLAPLGLTLGMAMPIGLRRLAELHPEGVAWAWGINGVTSVLASALGIAVAITFGFAVATLVGLGFYLMALAHAVLGRWPQEGAAAPVRDEPSPEPVVPAA